MEDDCVKSLHCDRKSLEKKGCLLLVIGFDRDNAPLVVAADAASAEEAGR